MAKQRSTAKTKTSKTSCKPKGRGIWGLKKKTGGKIPRMKSKTAPNTKDDILALLENVKEK